MFFFLIFSFYFQLIILVLQLQLISVYCQGNISIFLVQFNIYILFQLYVSELKWFEQFYDINPGSMKI